MAIKEESLSPAKQENLLAILCFDKKNAATVKAAIEIELFGSSVYRNIAEQAINFLDTYKEPISDHLADIFEDELEDKDARKRKLYESVFENLYHLKDTVNTDFTLDSLRQFVRSQRLKQGVTEAAGELQAGRVVEAENYLRKAIKTDLVSFDPGLVLRDDPTGFLDSINKAPEFISLGIPHFDRILLGPEKKTLLLWLAAANRGKSWALIHTGKCALLARKKVLHITLEMSQPKVAARYVQSFFSIKKREADLKVPIFEEDDGQLTDLSFIDLDRPCLHDKGVESLLKGKLEKLAPRINLIIKQFPTGQLTMSGLHAYLDQLEHQQMFIPDVVILDYADLMKLDSNNLRISTGLIYKDLRGLAVERNIAIASASQTNREGEHARIATLKLLGEDYSKAATADIIISYNQTPEERALNLARLFVAKNRDEEAHSSVLIAQAYAAGQFCLSSIRQSSNYWDLVDEQ